MSLWRAAARLVRNPVALACAVALSTLLPLAHAQEASEPPIPDPVGFVNDPAGVIDDRTEAQLEAFLDQVKRKTGAEFSVLVVRSTAPLPPSEYKTMVFERWGIGRRGHDDGLLMLVAIEEREVRFETGYGLEGTLPDGLQSRIFRDEMAPRFRADDYAGGIIAGVLRCAERIAAEKGVTLEWEGRELRYRETPAGRMPFWLVLLLALGVMLVIVIANRGSRSRRGRRRGRDPWRDTGWGGWGGWGGGLGGGGWGGGFGGGGSFGGFGGGSSGGGGGGGSW